MLVAIETLCRIVFLEPISFKVTKQRGLYRDLVLSNDQSLTFTDGLVSLVPWMLLDLGCCQSLIGVRLQDLVDQVDTLGGKSLRHLELAT